LRTCRLTGGLTCRFREPDVTIFAQAIRKELTDTFFLMAVNHDHMKGSDIEEARKLFPTSCKVRVLRNNLVRKAMEGTEWWPFADRLKGSNMYIFVKKDVDLKATIEASIKMEKRFAREGALAAGLEKMGGASALGFKLQHMHRRHHGG